MPMPASNAFQLIQMNKIEDLKELLNCATSAKLGQYGEHLLEKILHSIGLDFKRIHKGGVDFEIKGYGSVDLKTKNCLSKFASNHFQAFPYKISNVTYFYMNLYDDKVCVYVDDNKSISTFAEVSWSQCIDFLPDFFFEKRSELNSNSISQIKKDVKNWVLNEWGLTARVISRAGRKAQDSFEKNGWGPNNFYSNEKQKKLTQLTILIYFDGEDIYKIFAYPVGLSDEIDWFPKDKGPNKQGVMIFDPRDLNEKFKFSSIYEFKNSYPERMA